MNQHNLDGLRNYKLGVSPAFVVSSYGTSYTISDYCVALSRIHGLGFRNYQPEIYHGESLEDWTQGGAKRVACQAVDMGLVASQFVAHFLMGEFSTRTRLDPSGGLDMLKRCLELLPLFQPCDVLTLPIGPFDFHVDQTQESRRGLRSRFVEKLQHYLRVVQNAGFKLALEILPNSLIGDMNGFLDLFQELKSPNLGVNLDTGHAWNCGENVPSLPEKLKGRIFGLHLKDNQETDGSYGTPGTGSIALPHFLKNLTSGGYRGSLDLEINCKAEAVEREYKAGRQYLQNILYPTNVVEIPYRSHKQATRT